MLLDEAEGPSIKQSRVYWSFSLCPSRSTLHPSLPIWTTSPGLPYPLTSSRDLHRSTSRLEWEKKAPFWIFLLLLPALCPYHASGSGIAFTTSAPLRHVPWLSLGSSSTISFPHPCRPKGGHNFLLLSPPLLVPSTLLTPLQIVPSLNYLQNPSCDALCFLLGP